MAEGGSEYEERDRIVLITRELFHGRFNDQETRQLLQHFNWNRSEAVGFVFSNEANAVRQLIHGKSENEIVNIQSDGELASNAKMPRVPTRTRLFACQDCDHYWWRKVPQRKQVSKCHKCQTKYKPVPRAEEWGWASFDCNCGNSFSGFGKMGVPSECYKCHEHVSPHKIVPPSRRRGKPSHKPHSCDGDDCCSRPHGRVNPNQRGPGYAVIYERNYNGNQNQRGTGHAIIDERNPNAGGRNCVHPRSRHGKKRVLYASERHISTGSTVDTFLPQHPLDDSPFNPDLDPISEGSENGDDST